MRSRGPTTASPPVPRRSTTTGTWGAVSRSRAPSPSMRVTRVGPGPLPRRTLSAWSSPCVRFQSSEVRRRAAVVRAARSGCAASVARTSERTASASPISANSRSSACAAASRRPLRRPDHRSDSQVPSATTGLSSAKNRNVGVCRSHAMAMPPTAGSATATHASRRRGGGAGGRGNRTSTSARGALMRGTGRRRRRPSDLPSRGAAGAAGPASVTALEPILRTAPVGQSRGRSSSSAPSSRLPLLDPRSATVTAPPPTWTAACVRETSGSCSRMGTPLPRPMTCRPWASGSDRPASGPPTTCSSSALDARAGCSRRAGRPSPRTAPWSRADMVRGRSFASRAESAQRPSTGRPTTRLIAGSTSATRCREAVVISTSNVPASPDSVQHRVAVAAGASPMEESVTAAILSGADDFWGRAPVSCGQREACGQCRLRRRSRS